MRKANSGGHGAERRRRAVVSEAERVLKVTSEGALNTPTGSYRKPPVAVSTEDRNPSEKTQSQSASRRRKRRDSPRTRR